MIAIRLSFAAGSGKSLMAAITVAVAQLAGVTNSRDTLLGTLEEQYRAAGAHFVLRSASDLLPVLDEINARLANE